MPVWDELFKNEKFRRGGTVPEVFDLAFLMKSEFSEKNLRVWDVGCGAGRHTVFFARNGFDTYATDISENGINLTNEWLRKEGCNAKLKLAEVINNPWNDVKFHGILSWNVLQHMNIEEFSKNIEILKDYLLPKGFILLSLISTKAQDCGMGEMVEKNSYRHTEGIEKGVIHHYFEKDELKSFFKGWKFKIFIEVIQDMEVAVFKRMSFPFRNGHFIVCAQK